MVLAWAPELVLASVRAWAPGSAQVWELASVPESAPELVRASAQAPGQPASTTPVLGLPWSIR